MFDFFVHTRTGFPWIKIDYIEFLWSVSINFDNYRLYKLKMDYNETIFLNNKIRI